MLVIDLVRFEQGSKQASTPEYQWKFMKITRGPIPSIAGRVYGVRALYNIR